MSVELGKFVVNYLLFPVIVLIFGLLSVVIAKKNKLLSDKKAVITVLLSSLLYSSFGLSGFFGMEFMPYVYLFQLARSDYGYLQYLTTDTDSAKMLLDFAIWRTQICRGMEAKAADMSKALLQLAK